MRRSLMNLVVTAAACGALSNAATLAVAQTPTYAPTTPLVAPGDPVTTPDTTTLPSMTIPPTAVPNSNSSPTPTLGTPYQIPSGSTVDPGTTVVTPGTAIPATPSTGTWYPGYWLGYRPGAPPYGGGPVPYRTNYQGFAPYGASAPGACGSCNTCPTPCGPQNLEFGRGYDGFMTGW
ncbi:hypothetical protein SH661x_004713 [Planctomicrobium sp. SH661]|uniref:hypothetical protein n=1 Tax=Planctomicrobium sp. SH661 TaxID=3448124 RepID=UPI003F5C03AB